MDKHRLVTIMTDADTAFVERLQQTLKQKASDDPESTEPSKHDDDEDSTDGNPALVTNGGLPDYVRHMDGLGDQPDWYRCTECGRTEDDPADITHHEKCPGEHEPVTDGGETVASRVMPSENNKGGER
jgi:hypothetical protein